VLYAKDTPMNDDEEKKDDEEKTLPEFVKGESGPHQPTLSEKWTTPPKYYTEATLLRAMETAGKFVEDEELRNALKENGIGRPSSRAGIIETLFKRHYIMRQRKNLLATATGIELIDTIREELLKSCELTGIWEKKLRDIEHGKFDPGQFVSELKQQISQIVWQVLNDRSVRRITTINEEDMAKQRKPARQKTSAGDKGKATRGATSQKKKTKSSSSATPSTPTTPVPATSPSPSPATPSAPAPSAPPAPPQAGDVLIGQPCPVCGQGTIIKGRTAYGCSRWREGCTYRQLF
jgi:DNA topoisomerase-3